MANIPVIPGSALVRDVQIGAKVDPGPTLQRLGAQRSAIKAAGGAIQETLNAVSDYEVRKQRAWEAAAFNHAGIVTNKVTATFTEALRKANTEDQIKQIVPQWQGMVAQTKDTLLNNPDLTPAAKGRLGLNLDSWAGTSTTGFQEASDKKASAYRKSVAITASAEFLKSGDPEKMQNASAALDLAVKSGDMFPGEAGKLKEQFPERLATAQAYNTIASNPYKAVKDLEDGAWPLIKNDAIRTGIEAKANAAWSRLKSQKYGEIRTNQLQGRIYTKPELTQMAQIGDIDGKSVDEILKTQRHDSDPTDTDINISKVHDMVRAIPKNASDDERLEAVATLHGSKEYQSLPNEVKKDFDGAIKEGAKGQPSPAKQIENKAMDRIDSDPIGPGSVVKQLTGKSGDSYNMTDSEVKRRFGVRRDEAVRQYEYELAQQKDSMRLWSKQHEKDNGGQGPNEEETEAARQKIVVLPKMNAALKIMAGKPIHTPEQVEHVRQNLINGKAWNEGSTAQTRMTNANGDPVLVESQYLQKALAAGWKIRD